MRSDNFRGFQGSLLVLAAALATLWLGVTNQMNLYVNPRYIAFALIMAVFAVVMVVVGAKYGVEAVAPSPAGRRRVVLLLSAVAGSIGILFVLAVKPAALTAATANQRGVNVASIGVTTAASQIPSTPSLFETDDYSNLTVKDWAGLLAQVSDASFFTGKQAKVTGFITADQSDPQNMFYVTRFVITCCVVDARPLGVAVYAPGWQSKFASDDWVEISGPFILNPSRANLELVAVKPTAIGKVAKPDNPYE